MTLNPGATLQGGKYEVKAVLGQGGYGITYLAEQTQLCRNVALKEFYLKELCDRVDDSTQVTMGTTGSRELISKMREKFSKEARNIAQLNHPHIVKVLDIFEENNTAYYVMEFCSGGSLSSKLKNQGHLSEADASRYMLQVAKAIQYIHGQHMNHLDIKPGNIMLNSADEAVLIDFGLSKQYDSQGEQTSTSNASFTEGYAPLEQYNMAGVTQFSPETDIYALGATFYKLLTGITPPRASEVLENGLPVDVLKNNGVSDQTIALITKAMEPRRKARMKDVAEFIAMLNSSEPAQAAAQVDEDESTRILPGKVSATPAEDDATRMLPPKKPAPKKTPAAPKTVTPAKEPEEKEPEATNMDPELAPKAVSFLDAITRAYKKSFTLKGRASLSEFWWFGGVMNLIVIIIGCCTSGYGFLLLPLVWIPYLTLMVRRLHDVGKSGWWFFGLFVFVLQVYVIFIIMFGKSQPDNKYGPTMQA